MSSQNRYELCYCSQLALWRQLPAKPWLKTGFPFSLPVNCTVIILTAGRSSGQTSAVSGLLVRVRCLAPGASSSRTSTAGALPGPAAPGSGEAAFGQIFPPSPARRSEGSMAGSRGTAPGRGLFPTGNIEPPGWEPEVLLSANAEIIPKRT